MKIANKLTVWIIIAFALILSISALLRYLVFDPVTGNAVLIEQGLVMYTMEQPVWKLMLYLHIITASAALAIGPFTFLQRKKTQAQITIHRTMGMVYVICILLSGCAGIYLSWYAFGGIGSKLGFFCLSVAWLVFTAIAYCYILKKQVALHKEWMIRSYAITFVAVTFRIWSALVGYSLDNFAVGYVAAIWLALLGNIAVAEIWIRLLRSSVRR